ncbi:MAG: YicC family protein [Lachnospiraceae bacterium]|nr:YicC family protein [Lachnospiraceae bacterium]
MIRSMTGFGRAEITTEEYKVSVEIKSVNHRYLDLSVKLPGRIAYTENNIRNTAKEKIIRGKTDIYIVYEETKDKNIKVTYNPDIAKMYMDALNEMSKDFNLESDIRLSTLSRYPEVLEIREENPDEDLVWERIKKPLNDALDKFIESRTVEGKRLADDLISKCDALASYVDTIEERSPQIINEYKERLTKKVEELFDQKPIDESRIATEVTIYADKICVDEEIVRLKSHISQMKDMLKTGNEVGRKLDFITQEMNRESNTILSKSTDVEVCNIGIEMKTLVEKIREQIQNLE